jgi:hypothetical protein
MGNSYSKFRKNTLERLTKYKENELKIKKRGTYRGKEYNHILPKNKERENLIQPLNSFYEDIKREIKLHRNYHHLNSSQALTINFFYPFEKGIMNLNNSDLSKILLSLTEFKKDISYIELEKVSDKEKSETTKTNFDVFMKTTDNEEVYIEAKYTEKGFGKANYKSKTVLNDNKSIILAHLLAEKTIDDEKYIRKFQVYKNVIEEYNLKDIINPEYIKMTNFYDNYQIMRNILHVDDNSYVYFIIPKENKSVEEELKIIDDVILVDAYRKRIEVIYWEDLLSVTLMYLKEYGKLDALNYFSEFAEKYFDKH